MSGQIYLQVPKVDKEVDVLDSGLRDVLSQEDPNSTVHPGAYASRKLQTHVTMYTVIEKLYLTNYLGNEIPIVQTEV